ncbi:hypothetical protein [Facilibium subflavum]|nr:hypothetical protein [Facilibium subflavum]
MDSSKVVASFDASIGSVQDPQDAYYRAYPASTQYTIQKDNGQTFIIR